MVVSKLATEGYHDVLISKLAKEGYLFFLVSKLRTEGQGWLIVVNPTTEKRRRGDMSNLRDILDNKTTIYMI